MLFATILNCCFSVFAQYAENYTPLQCSGKVPEDWRSTVSQKFEDKKVEKTGNRSERSTKADKNVFYLETTFSVDNMLRSGWVLYNDPITSYLEKVKAELQKSNPDIPENIRIYTLRSPEVNAFATDGGIIFVTMGLMAKVNNEAELALIIGHEIGHVMKQHSLNKYLEAKNLDKESPKSFNGDAQERKMLKYHAYAKENETEADEMGLNFVLKTDYATSSLENVYEMLRLAETPFVESAFPLEMLETDFMKIKGDIFLPEIEPIKGKDETKSDSLSTHPNIAARKKMLKNSLDKVKKEGGKAFLVSEETFKEMQQIARFELPMAYIDSDLYEEALYISAYLLKEYPQNIYLKKTFAKAMYKIAKSNTSSEHREVKDFDDIEGALLQVHIFSRNTPEKKWNILAANYLWRLMQDYPKEAEIKLMCKDLMVDMQKHISNRDFFKGFAYWEAEKEKSMTETKTEIIAAPTKTENPKEEKLVEMIGILGKVKVSSEVEAQIDTLIEGMHGDKERNANDIQYAFLEYVEDTAFISMMESARKVKDENEAYERFSKTEKYKKEVTKRMKKGWAMGLDNVVVLAPNYWTFQKNLLSPKTHSLVLTAEKKEKSINEMLKVHASKIGINAELLGEKNLTETDTEKFNDYVMVNRWINEALDAGKMNIMPMYHDELMKIAKKYQTDNFVYTNIVSVRYSNNLLRLYWTMFVPVWIAPPIMPILLYEQFKHHHNTRINSFALNVRTGDIIPLKNSTFPNKDDDAFLNAHIYDILLQLHKNK